MTSLAPVEYGHVAYHRILTHPHKETSMVLADQLKAALATALFTFLGGLLLLAQGWFASGELPDWSTAKNAIVALALAAISGLINFGARALQAKAGKGTVPMYVQAGAPAPQ